MHELPNEGQTKRMKHAARNFNERRYCGDRQRGCGAELSETDFQVGFCTQCGFPLIPEILPLEQALLQSLQQIQSERDAA